MRSPGRPCQSKSSPRLDGFEQRRVRDPLGVLRDLAQALVEVDLPRGRRSVTTASGQKRPGTGTPRNITYGSHGYGLRLLEQDEVVGGPDAVLVPGPVLAELDALPRPASCPCRTAPERHPGFDGARVGVGVELQLVHELREVAGAVVAAEDRFLGDPFGGFDAVLAGERVGEQVKEAAELDAQVALRDGARLRAGLGGQGVREVGLQRGAVPVADDFPACGWSLP
jgi:hypothetical protein